MDRRQFLKVAMSSTAALAIPLHASAAAPTQQRLRIVERSIEVKGRAAKVFGLLQPGGAHGLSLAAGSDFDVALRNESPEPTIIHWHGLTPPWAQDGVADAPQPPLAPQATRAFRFPVGAPGTHWMHAHTLQEQNLLAAPLIVFDPAELGRDEQEVVILLHDFSFTPVEQVLSGLQSGGHAGTGTTRRMNLNGEMGPTSRMGHSRMELGAFHGGPMMPMDLNDIDYDAYLANDRTLDDPEVVRVESGGRVRLRIINGASATAFTIDLGALDGQLIAVDGQDVVPVNGRRFPVTMGQRLDIRLTLPRASEAFPILALREAAEERTGIVLAPPNALVKRLATAGEPGPIVDLALEARLRAARPLAALRPGRRFDMTLLGGMQGYQWGLEVRPKLSVQRGERVEVTMRNMSMMAHPMHLHGHHFQVVAIDGRRLAGALRDTVHVPPHRAVTVALDANNPGDWAFHCHHLYHMAAGMMTTLSYDGVTRT